MGRRGDTMRRGQGPGPNQLESEKKMSIVDLEVNAVLRKTESGHSAIKLRDRALTPKHRMLLIMVDGSKTVADLSNPMPDPAQARQALAELLSAGLVSPADAPKEVVKTVLRATPELAPVASEAPAVALKVAIRRTTRLLENLLGPTCEPLCLQLEKCQSLDQFTRKVQDFRRIVASMRSEKKADEFVSAALAPS